MYVPIKAALVMRLSRRSSAMMHTRGSMEVSSLFTSWGGGERERGGMGEEE